MSTLVCFALKVEAAPFQKRTAPSVASLLITGVGRRNAEKSIREFLAGRPPERVLTCGFAGGLKPDLKLGDVLFELPLPNLQLATRLSAAGAIAAKFFCADRIATTAAEKKTLRAETGADAVEMESAAIHAVCAERGIPCATVRVISDTANEDLPLDFNALARPNQSLDFGKLFAAIARTPGSIPALLRLRKQTRFAAEQLANVLVKIIR